MAWCQEQSPLFGRAMQRAAVERGIKPWRGQPLADKRLLVLGDHGLGDTIMCLRYLPLLRSMGADVVLWERPEIARLVEPLAWVVHECIDADYSCSILTMLGTLGVEPGNVESLEYLAPTVEDVEHWRDQLGPQRGPRVGVAWSVGKVTEGDYPRSMPLSVLLKGLPITRPVGTTPGADDAEIHAVQQGDGEGEILVDGRTVRHHWFEDLADCAALMSLMDRIVTVDTAAAHLAGATGHPNLTIVLSPWHSWRWQASWYPHTQLRIVA
jgi:hypothetical protein